MVRPLCSNSRMKSRCLFVRLAVCMALIGAFPFSVLAQQSAPATPAAPVAESSAAFAQARKLVQQGKVDEAISQLRAMESRDPSIKGLDLELGTAYYKKSDYPNAIQYLKKANEGDPENREAIQLLGMSYFAGGH